MDEIKRELGSWWMWVLGLTVVTAVVFGVLNSVGLIGRTAVERMVFEESIQRSSAVKAKIATYRAQIAALEGRLAGATVEKKAEIQGQIDSLNILLAAEEE